MTNTPPPSSNPTTQEFLKLLFANAEGSFIELRFLYDTKDKKGNPPKRIVFCKTIQEVVDVLPRNVNAQEECGVFFGACPREERNGTKSSVKKVQCLWVDLDAKDFAGGKDEAWERIQNFIPPTVIIDSGHGFHCYWCLVEPTIIENKADLSKLERLNYLLAELLGGDKACAEIARVLRLPGTFNLKDLSNPQPVKIIELVSDRRYSLSSFDPILSAFQKRNPLPATTNQPGWLESTLKGLRDGSRDDCHRSYSKVIGKLLHAGLRKEDVLELLTPHLHQVTHEGHHFSDEDLKKLIGDMFARYPATPSPSSSYIEGKAETEPTFEVVSLSQLVSGEDIEIDWLIQDFLANDSVGILAAQPGMGKSWLFMELAIEFSRGGLWLGKFKTKGGGVLYIDEETPKSLLKRRFRRLLKAKKLNEDGLNIHFAVWQGLCLTNPASVLRLEMQLKILKPALVIIDSLIRVHRAEENSATEMAGVFEIVKRLVHQYQCSFLFTDHQRKTPHFPVGGGQLVRGSSEKVAFIDSLFVMEQLSDDGTLCIEHAKSRFGQPIPSFVVRLQDDAEGGTSVVYAGEAEGLKQAVRLERVADFIEKFLRSDERMSRQAIVEKGSEAGFSEKAVDEGLKTLTAQGVLQRENVKKSDGRGGKEAFYRLKAQGESGLPQMEMALGMEAVIPLEILLVGETVKVQEIVNLEFVAIGSQEE